MKRISLLRPKITHKKGKTMTLRPKQSQRANSNRGSSYKLSAEKKRHINADFDDREGERKRRVDRLLREYKLQEDEEYDEDIY